MSENETLRAEKDEPDSSAQERSDPPRPNRFRREPLLPEAGAGGAPLTAVIAVMSFLAVLAMTAALSINRAAGAWTSELRSEITIQVKGADAAEIETGSTAAMRILGDTDGVIEAELISSGDAASLLDPWLGKGNAAAFLNIPAIIKVRVTPELRNDLSLLRARLEAAAPGANLDDHAQWHDRLARTARSGQALAFAVFILVMGAACAVAAFAARAGLAANHEIVSVLHLVGATDAFIAAEVQRRFFILGLRGAVTGLVTALGAIALIGAAARSATDFDAFLPGFLFNQWQIIWLIAVPVVTCLVTAITARIAVLRALREQY